MSRLQISIVIEFVKGVRIITIRTNLIIIEFWDIKLDIDIGRLTENFINIISNNLLIKLNKVDTTFIVQVVSTKKQGQLFF